MKIRRSKFEGSSLASLVASAAIYIAAERSGIAALDSSPNGMFTILVLFLLVASVVGVLFTTTFSLKASVQWTAMHTFQLFYLLATAYSSLLLGTDYDTVNIFSWLIFIIFVLLVSISVGSRLFERKDNFNLHTTIMEFGLIFLVLSILALGFGLKRDVMGIDDYQALYSGSAALISLPTFSSNNVGAVFLALFCIVTTRRRIYPIALVAVVGYLLYLGARMALAALFLATVYRFLPRVVKRAMKWPILLLPIVIIPIVIFWGASLTPESGSPYGALNGRQTIWGLSLLGVQNLSIGQFLVGSGMFGHFVTENYGFAFMFPADSGVQLVHNSYLQVFFDLGLVGVFLLFTITKRMYEAGGVGPLIAVFLSVVSSTETALLPYYPATFIFFVVTYLSLRNASARQKPQGVVKAGGGASPERIVGLTK